MKAQRNKLTGKLKIIVSSKDNPNTEAKANRQFAKSLRESKNTNTTLKQVNERKYVDTRPSLRDKS